MRTRPVGQHALLVEVADTAAAVTVRAQVLQLAAETGASGLAPPRDVVPAACTVLLDGLPGPTAVAAWRSRLGELGLPETAQSIVSGSREQRIEVTYDGADVDVVARAWGCSPTEMIRRHQDVVFSVAFCGFAPGFAYCVPDQELPEVPRRDQPRDRVPSGSVAMAGEYCGVYPAEMPGGWQLIGRTPAVLFDPGRTEPALLAPGDRVRFVASP
jgi:allophanate hydrolase subunit 1